MQRNTVEGYIKFAGNVARSNTDRLDFPYKLTFAVTYRCNYRCKMCNIWQLRPKDELTLEEIDRFFATSNRFQWIDFTGGEPWLRKDFVGIFESALRHCPGLVMLHFPTNGFMTDRIVAGVKEIMRMRPPRLVVTVSTDGDEEVNDEVRGVSGGWKRQIETYRRLHELPGVGVVLGMTVSSLNVGQYDKAFAAAKAACPWLTAKDFHLNIAHESAHYYRNVGSGALSRDTERTIQQVKDYRKQRGLPTTPTELLEWQYLRHAEKYLRTGMTPMRCHSLKASCFVDSWGYVYPCAMYDHKVAGLRDYDYDLAAIWNLPETKRLQQEIWDYKCPQCWTPCEAYQTILANGVGLRRGTPATARRAGPASALPHQAPQGADAALIPAGAIGIAPAEEQVAPPGA